MSTDPAPTDTATLRTVPAAADPAGALAPPAPRVDVADLVGAVTAVPGVSGLAPGIATALRTLDARLRRSDASSARYGLVVDRDSGEVTVEIGVEGPLPVRRIVEDVQRTVQRAVSGAAAEDTDPRGGTAVGADPDRPAPDVPRVLVRVQSLSTP